MSSAKVHAIVNQDVITRKEEKTISKQGYTGVKLMDVNILVTRSGESFFQFKFRKERMEVKVDG